MRSFLGDLSGNYSRQEQPILPSGDRRIQFHLRMEQNDLSNECRLIDRMIERFSGHLSEDDHNEYTLRQDIPMNG